MARLLGALLLLLILFLCQVMARTDGEALLMFKAGVSSDPSGALRSWNHTVSYCLWRGVTCNQGHVTSLNISSLSLAGNVSPAIGNLTSLEVLDFNYNCFSGSIPASIGKLKRLWYLGLCDSALTGDIPVSFGNCSGLQYLYLSRNNLTGTIPKGLGTLLNLRVLGLSDNKLFGNIPRSLQNITKLWSLQVDQNLFEGSLPEGLSRLPFLQYLYVNQNSLSGSIPLGFFNMSSIIGLSLASNAFIGHLPSDAGEYLPNLETLLLGGNNLAGAIPVSLANASKLSYLSLSSNKFSGHVPNEIGTLPLQWLQLSDNELTSNEASGWGFVEYLTNSRTLEEISLNGNNLGGTIPISISNLSPGLQILNLANNRIHGGIPLGIGQFTSLQTMALELNVLSGIIPEDLGKLSNIRELSLQDNMLSGSIPSSIGNLTELLSLNLGNNLLNGSVPAVIGDLHHLTNLNLSHNSLDGKIPKEIFSLWSLSLALDLSNNQLRGSVPQTVQLRNLAFIDLSNNYLSGQIPEELANCQSLEFLRFDGNFFTGGILPSFTSLKGLRRLNLTNNQLSGTIPPSLARMSGLQELYLSMNNLTGNIPVELENMSSLGYLDLSYNQLTGRVPFLGVFANKNSFKIVGNVALCGGITLLHLSPCSDPTHEKHKNLFLEIALPTFASALLVSMIFTILWWRKRKIGNREASVVGEAIDNYPRVSYIELARATDGFASANLIGTGKYGQVYRGILPLKVKGSSKVEDISVAVKVFDLGQIGASKTFLSECETLRSIRHRNLIRIITCCSSTDTQGNDFRALVFEFKQNYSLDKWIHQDSKMINKLHSLSITQRLNIAVDSANALTYLHNNCRPPIVHCDLKPSNILLDEDMTAYICDFGLARLVLDPAISQISANCTSTIGIKGTIGYVAPEYGMTSEVSTSGDVYSFGIMLLEIFSGMTPTDDIFKDGFTLHEFVRIAFPDKIEEIIDPALLPTEHSGRGMTILELSADEDRGRIMRESLVSAIRIALSCSRQVPLERMKMSDVATEMSVMRDAWMSACYE